MRRGRQCPVLCRVILPRHRAVIRIEVLGDPLLSGPRGPFRGRATYKRRLALLSILAAARGRPVGRERLMALLWSELPAESARHSLSEALYVLRKELGEGVFVLVGGEVGLSAAHVESDVDAFERALEEGRAGDAAGLYRGPFMDGFHVSDAPEYERWADGERDRLARLYARAVQGLAEAAEAGGDALEAVEWWRRLAAHDPYSSRVALRLARALRAAGEGAAALRHVDAHAAFLAEELGVGPDGELLEFAAGLRAEAVPAPRPAPPVRASGPVAIGSVDVDRPAEGADGSRSARSIDPPSSAGSSSADPSSTDSPSAGSSSAGSESIDRSPADSSSAGSAGGSSSTGSAGSGPASTGPASIGATGSGSSSAEPEDTPVRADAHPPTLADGAGEDGGRGATAHPPSTTQPPRTRGRRIRGGAYGAALLVLALAIVLAAVNRPVEAPPRYDPRRVAVMYFDDNSPGGELGYLARGLTEMLIHELGQVHALDVVSRNGVKPYRDGRLPLDSVAARLRVGSVVEGSVQRAGDRVQVTVNLVDANTQSQLESRVIVHPLGDVIALQGALAREVSRSLRSRLGREVRLRQARTETRSGQALALVLRAEAVRADAADVARATDARDAAAARRLLARADSLLAAAQAADPRWPRPALLRGWVGLDLSELVDEPARPPHLRRVEALAGDVLRRVPASAEALELRGTARWQLAVRDPDAVRDSRRMELVERDLRAAVAADSSRAGAWATLSRVLVLRGRFAEAGVAARRALDADAFLTDADGVLLRLYFGALYGGEYRLAGEVCDRGRALFPGDWHFVECRLTLLRDDPSAPPDTALARRLVAELERLDPSARAVVDGRAYAPLYRRMVAAAVLARAGDAPRARAEVARARAAAAGDPDSRVSLLYDEAYVHLLLGEGAQARTRVQEYLAARPALRPFIARNPALRSLLSPEPAPGARAGSPSAAPARPG